MPRTQIVLLQQYARPGSHMAYHQLGAVRLAVSTAILPRYRILTEQ